MKNVTRVTVICDTCYREIESEGDEMDADIELEELGWLQLDNEIHMCPECINESEDNT